MQRYHSPSPPFFLLFLPLLQHLVRQEEHHAAVIVVQIARYADRPPDKPVTVELKTSSDTATVKIIDRGIGIPVAERDKIFERFYRTDKARTKIDEGNSVGLGLSIAKWIADRHDIKIDVQSKSGEGSVFVLTIPTIESY